MDLNFDELAKRHKQSDQGKCRRNTRGLYHQNSFLYHHMRSLSKFKGLSLRLEDLIMWVAKGYCVECYNKKV